MALITSSGGFRDTGSVTTADEFAVTSYVAGLSLASNEAGAANVAKVLGEVIRVLIDKGILKGTVNS
jgi:hypothetical protein